MQFEEVDEDLDEGDFEDEDDEDDEDLSEDRDDDEEEEDSDEVCVSGRTSYVLYPFTNALSRKMAQNLNRRLQSASRADRSQSMEVYRAWCLWGNAEGNCGWHHTWEIMKSHCRLIVLEFMRLERGIDPRLEGSHMDSIILSIYVESRCVYLSD